MLEAGIETRPTLLDIVSDYSANKRTTLGNYKVLSSNSSVRLFTFYTLPDSRVLNSFEELCIMRTAAVNSFARVLNPHGGVYIYIYIYTVFLYDMYIYIYIYAVFLYDIVIVYWVRVLGHLSSYSQRFGRCILQQVYHFGLNPLFNPQG